jgi:hypothetical protein
LGNYLSHVDFYEEDGGNLRLCLDDIHQGNFRKDTSGRLFALDFAKTNLLPFAFQDLAFVDGDDLAEEVGKSLNCSKSKYRGALKLAAGNLQLFNNSSHGGLFVCLIFARMLRNGQVFPILFVSRSALVTYSSRRCLQLALLVLTSASVVYTVRII